MKILVMQLKNQQKKRMVKNLNSEIAEEFFTVLIGFMPVFIGILFLIFGPENKILNIIFFISISVTLIMAGNAIFSCIFGEND